jgi:cytochrome c5
MTSKRFLALPYLILLQMGCVMTSASANEAGRRIYNQVCIACHAPENVMVSSPKAGDAIAWKKRLAKGLQAATDNAVNGFGAMPAKGGATDLSPEQISLAIQYMATPTN